MTNRALLSTLCVLTLGVVGATKLPFAQEQTAPTEPVASEATAQVITAPAPPSLLSNLFEADDKNIQYVGRINFSDPKRPRFSAPGVYIKARFFGPTCDIVINDEVLWDKTHNYITIAVDNQKPIRVQLTGKTNTIRAAYGLAGKAHVVTVAKDTESNLGELTFVGFRCQKLLPLSQPSSSLPVRKIEFYGDSITVGMGSDTSKVECGKGEWYDQHNAYQSYGAITARELGAQYQLTAYSGIGLMKSCCDIKVAMPDIWDKVNLRTNTDKWDFKKFQPQVVTVCLGQNDGVQPAEEFRKTYIDFLGKLRKAYPKAQIVCLTSPMGNAQLTTFLKENLTQIVNQVNAKGDKRVSRFFFARSYNDGCQSHPSVAEHQQIAAELTAYLKTLMKW